MIAQLLNAVYNDQVAQGIEKQVALNVNPLTLENYPYFKEDLEYVREALQCGEGKCDLNCNTVTSMVEVYVDRDADGEPDYLIIETVVGGQAYLYRCGWGMPATLNRMI